MEPRRRTPISCLAGAADPTQWLDVACGTGALTSAILAHCNPEEVIGLDTSSDYLSAAQKSCMEPRVRFVAGDATVLSFPSITRRRFRPSRGATICSEQGLRDALVAAGCASVETRVFDDSGEFPSREAYWQAFEVRQGSTYEYLSLLSEEQRLRLRTSLLSTMNPHGPVKLRIRALAVKGLKPLL